MPSNYYKDLVTDQELNAIIEANTEMFGSRDGREWLSIGLSSTRKGYSNGSGVTALLEHFGLISKGKTLRNRKLTKKGLLYLLSISEEKRQIAENALIITPKNQPTND